MYAGNKRKVAAPKLVDRDEVFRPPAAAAAAAAAESDKGSQHHYVTECV